MGILLKFGYVRWEEHQFSSEMRIEDGNLVWGNNWLISFDVMNYYHGDLFGYYE